MPQLRDFEAQQSCELTVASARGGGRRGFCVLPGTVTDIQPDTYPPPQLPEFLNICIYSCLSRA